MSDMNNELSEEDLRNSVMDTKDHIRKVYKVAKDVTDSFLKRVEKHDASKLDDPEKTMFAKHGKNLSSIEYGTKDYDKEMEEMKKDCLNHHYENNSHHPEHYPNGVNDMDIFDILNREHGEL